MGTMSSRYRCTRVFMAVFALLVFGSVTFAPSIFAQSGSTGALTGTLRDASGAVLPNATVTLTSIDTAQVRTATTGADGTYKFGLLPPGNYRLKFEASGFSTVEVPSATVAVTETDVLDETMQVGAQTQAVEVTARTEAVQTATTTVGAVVDSQTITATPLTSRNYTNLLGLSAGANAGVFNAANIGKGTQDMAVNGASIQQNNFQMDGASIQNWAGSESVSDKSASPGIGIINPDAIEEFKVQTSMFDAGYGRKPGASVNVVTKSGTNQFHGTAFEFFRNTDLNANDFFRKLNVAPQPNGRPVLNQNQFGGVFGGPIKKDKLFFFTSYQETRQINGLSAAGYSDPTLVGIPQGDRSNTAAFQAALGAAFCKGGPATVGNTGVTLHGGAQVACNGSNINPVAIDLLQLKNANGSYFIPSSPSGTNYNTVYSIPATFGEHQAVGNADYVINARNTLSGRWNFEQDLTQAPMGCGSASSAITQCLPGSPGQILFRTNYFVGKLTTTLSTSVVNEVRYSLQRFHTGLANGVPFTDTQVGIAPIIPSVNTLNGMTITGLMAWGGQYILTDEQDDTMGEVADQVSWAHGKHTIRAGFEYERDQNNFHFNGLALGNETFGTFYDFLLGLPGCSPVATTAACAASQTAGQTNGSAYSNILNTGTTPSITPAAGLDHEYRSPTVSAFLQDDFKVRSNLTLNLGVRWEYDALVYDRNGNNTNVWPSLIRAVPVPGTSPATGTLAGFVVPSNYNPALYAPPAVGGLFQNNKKISTQNSPPLANFAPRIGVAWKPLATDRFVVRTGFGSFYDRVGATRYDQSSVQNFPYSVPVFQSNQNNYYSTEAVPYVQGLSLGWEPRWENIAAGTGSNLNIISQNPIWLVPVTYLWNANIQYEFAPTWVLELGYVGSRGIHQLSDTTLISVGERQYNEPILATPSNPVNGITDNTTANAALRVPYLGFAVSGLAVDQAAYDTKFNSLQATVRKQFSHGLQMQAAYTWARTLVTSSYINYNDPDLPAQYGLAPYIHPQRLTVNYSWDLPFGQHEGIVGKVANGWNVAGVTVLQDGTPLTVSDGRGAGVYGSVATSTAEFAAGMGNANAATPGSVTQRLGGVLGGPGYINAAAFTTIPVIGAGNGGTGGTGYGDAGYGILLGPGQFNFDVSLIKTTVVGGINENATLVFRSEFFNAFNHPQFNNPGSLADSTATFGQITSLSVNPRLVQFALKYVF